MGETGPRAKDFNMRWIASLVGRRVSRVAARRRLSLSRRCARGYSQGRLRLLYEANPIAFLVEQAGGLAIDGVNRILDIAPQSMHARTPLIFGSTDKVERIRGYYVDGTVRPRARPCSAGAAFAADGERTPMSLKHPIIAITGSSGAGTTSVKHTFEQIFRREKINPVYIEGDAFHRWNRLEMREKMKEAAARGDNHYSHFGADANLFEELEKTLRRLRRDRQRADAPLYPRRRRGREARRRAGHLHRMGRIHAGLGPAVLRGPARLRRDRQGQCRPACRSQDRRRAGASISNGSRSCTATAPRAAIPPRRSPTRSCGACPITSITSCPQFTQTDINFQRVPTVDTSNPFIARWIPTPDESIVVIRFRDTHGIDFPYLLSMIHGSFMSRANSIVIPGGKLDIAMQLIFTPMILKARRTPPPDNLKADNSKGLSP